jgi:hypothetical protein
MKIICIKNNVEVNCKTGMQSIIGGKDYDSIRISVSGTTSNIPYSDIKVESFKAIENAGSGASYPFTTYFPSLTQSMSSSQSKTLFTSNQIPTQQFESLSQPVRFVINISAINGYTGVKEYKSGYVDLAINPSEVITPPTCPSFGNRDSVPPGCGPNCLPFGVTSQESSNPLFLNTGNKITFVDSSCRRYYIQGGTYQVYPQYDSGAGNIMVDVVLLGGDNGEKVFIFVNDAYSGIYGVWNNLGVMHI